MTDRSADPIVAPRNDAVGPLEEPPTFSVVIPAYQAASTIAETVASVLAQTASAKELIVSDDGSSDALAEALEPFSSGLRVVRGAHAGVGRARNAGVAACSGDFVLVVDADDVLLPRRLEALGRLGRLRPDLDLLCTDVFFERDGRRVGRFNDANPFAVDDQRRAILERCFVGWPAVRRARLLESGGFDESLPSAVDWECWMRLILAGAVAGLYDEPLAVYRLHPGSLTAERPRTLRDRVRMLEKARDLPDIGADERSWLERAIGVQRGRAALAEAEEAVAEGRADARRRCLDAARVRGGTPSDRLRALMAAGLPRRARSVAFARGGSRPPLARG